MDFETDGVWFCDNDRMKAWKSFEIEDRADVTLFDDDRFNNQFHGASPVWDNEAMYVDGDVTVNDDGSLDLNGINLYLTGSVTGGGDVTGTPVENITKTCYGDFDNDGDVDNADACVFCAAFTATATPTDNVLADYDFDGDVDDVDQAAFEANYNGSGNDPRCGCFPGGAAPLYVSAPDPLCSIPCP